MFIDILSIASTLIAAVIGIVGNTWDPSRRGLRKLTPTGRVLVVIAVIALASSIYQVIEKNKTASTKEQVARIAYGRILYNINEHILLPSFSFSEEIAGGDFKVEVSKFYSDMDYMRKTMNDSIGSMRDGSDVKLGDAPKKAKVGLIHKDMAWWEIFVNDFRQARAEIEATVAQYGAYMDPQVLLSVSRLIHSEAMIDVIEEIPALMKEDDTHAKYPIRTAELLQAYFFPVHKPSLFDDVAGLKLAVGRHHAEDVGP